MPYKKMPKKKIPLPPPLLDENGMDEEERNQLDRAIQSARKVGHKPIASHDRSRAREPKGKRGNQVSRKKVHPNAEEVVGANPTPVATSLSERLKTKRNGHLTELQDALKDIGEVAPMKKGTIKRLEQGDPSAMKEVQRALSTLDKDASTDEGHQILQEVRATNGHRDRFSQYESDPTGGEIDSATSALQDAAERPMEQSSLGREMFNDEDIDVKTRLSPKLVVQLQLAEMEAIEHETPVLLEFAEGIKRKNISLGGESRKEAVEMERGAQIGMTMDQFNRTKS